MSQDKRHLHRYVPSKPSHRPTSLSELAIIQKHHQFIRDEDADASAAQQGAVNKAESWEEQLARSWYNKLFREYALCDLTQYKTGGVALRWRTEEEVLDRKGELTCGSLKCKYHPPRDSPEEREDEDDRPLVPVELTPYQLNFKYQEAGEVKRALVKVVLCPRCARKLTYKKDMDREHASSRDTSGQPENASTPYARNEREKSPERRQSHHSERHRER